jgi:hypothetical protein
MLRDTFAVEYLLAGMPLEEVSRLLGHSSVLITQKHYAPWVLERQQNDFVAIYPEFRGLGTAESAIHRMIDIFGPGCGLVACKPWPLQFTPTIADDQEAIKRLALPTLAKARQFGS